MVKNKSGAIAYALHRFELGWADEALNLLEQAHANAKSKKESERTSLALGKLYLILNQASKAIPLLENIDHEDAQIYFQIGLVYRKLKQWAQAVGALEKANQLIPDAPQILANLGWVSYKNGQEEKGREFLFRSMRINHLSIQALADLARIYAADKKIYHAIACANRAIELDRHNTLAPETSKVLIELQKEFERHPPRPPKTKNVFEWQDYLSKVLKPGDVLKAAVLVYKPNTERELQQLGDKLMELWNTTPRPELGGLTPMEIVNKKPKPDQLEPLQDPKFMLINLEKAEANSLRRNMVSYLTHLQHVKYSATSTRGNLPLKAMYAINELLVDPIELENKIGDQIFKPQSSEDIWEFDFLHALATIAGLVLFAPGRRIKLTEKGMDFLKSAPNRQLWILFMTWWWQMNWLYVYHLVSFTDEVMDFLPYMTREILVGIPTGKWLNIKDFITIFIEVGNLDNYAETEHQTLINSAIEKIILLIPAEFDCVEIKTKPQKTRVSTFDKPFEFKVTNFGYELLSSL